MVTVMLMMLSDNVSLLALACERDVIFERKTHLGRTEEKSLEVRGFVREFVLCQLTQE